MLALYHASPGELLSAQLLGAGLALTIVRRQRPLKLAFNLAVFSFGSCLCALVFQGFLRLGDAYGGAGWAGALSGAANAVVGVLLVSVVIWLAAARPVVRELPRLIGLPSAGASRASAWLSLPSSWRGTTLAPSGSCWFQ